MIKNLVIIVLIATILSGCGGGNSEPSPVDNNKDRQLILQHWADDLIIPSYSQFKTKFDFFVGKTDAFTASPSTSSLAELRAAWVDAYIEWQKVELFEFGPADRYTLRNFFNIYPADVAGINSNILAGSSVNLDVPAEYARQGFPALDYLVNGVASDDAGIVSYYSGADGTKRIEYMKRLVSRMSSLINTVITEWNNSYKDTFVSKTGLDIGSSFGLVVNAYVLHYERFIRSGKFGIPSGATVATAGVPHPEKVEAVYKRDISKTLALNAHTAAVRFFNGNGPTTDGPSFKSYLDALGAKDAASGKTLAEIINAQFDEIASKVNTLSPDFYQQIQVNNQSMTDVYVSMQKAVRILKVDMTSAISITITYTDNDGD